MTVVRSRLSITALCGLTAVILAGCGQSALTRQPSVHPSEQTKPVPASVSPPEAYSAAVTKLHLISQDSCQTEPANAIYPRCDRYLAELRSAAGTIANGAPGLPGGEQVGKMASAVLGSATAFGGDGCGASLYAPGSAQDQACVSDLLRVRQAVTTLMEQTRPTAGSG
jgi:hypothetical protein